MTNEPVKNRNVLRWEEMSFAYLLNKPTNLLADVFICFFVITAKNVQCVRFLLTCYLPGCLSFFLPKLIYDLNYINILESTKFAILILVSLFASQLILVQTRRLLRLQLFASCDCNCLLVAN